MRDYTKEFNSLSPEIRLIGCAMTTQLRIQHLKFEKERLIKRHSQSLKEINEYIKNCEVELKRLEKQPPYKKT